MSRLFSHFLLVIKVTARIIFLNLHMFIKLSFFLEHIGYFLFLGGALLFFFDKRNNDLTEYDQTLIEILTNRRKHDFVFSCTLKIREISCAVILKRTRR